MKAIENIIFDLDGTLIDSSDGVVTAINYSFEKVGLPAQDADALKGYIGYPLPEMYRQYTDIPYDELLRYFQVKAAETVVSSTTVLPHVEDIVSCLQNRGYRLAVASTKIRPHIDGIVERFGWQSMFAALSGGDEVERVKPDPEILNLTLQRLQADRSRTVLIGDTINDVKAAQAVPMKVVAVASPYGGRDVVQASGPDFFIDSIEELLSLFPRREKAVQG